MKATYVVPCFNEAARLDPEAFAALLADARLALIAVDDGSSDATGARLAAIAAAHARMQVVRLHENLGKGEAVRAGMRRAIDQGAEVVGYADADFATPPSELTRLLDELVRTDAEAVLGARLKRLGADIRRSEVRHYVGRVFATVAALTVGAAVYDTQCGAKLFRVTPALEAALAAPFRSRWSFDVELLARLFGRLPTEAATRPERVVEVPLLQWHDIPGSKLAVPGMARAFVDLLGLWVRAERHARRR